MVAIVKDGFLIWLLTNPVSYYRNKFEPHANIIDIPYFISGAKQSIIFKNIEFYASRSAQSGFNKICKSELFPVITLFI